MAKANNATRKSKMHFEQVPLDVLKAIVEADVDGSIKPGRTTLGNQPGPGTGKSQGAAARARARRGSSI